MNEKGDLTAIYVDLYDEEELEISLIYILRCKGVHYHSNLFYI